jgi:hypothetical protein
MFRTRERVAGRRRDRRDAARGDRIVGVIAHSVARRTREMGTVLRSAPGRKPSSAS